jgi:small conductance mechanosensitive channel
MNKFIDWSAVFVPKLIWALLVIWIWFKIVSMINRWIEKVMEANDWDPMLESFITSLIAIVLKIMVFISAAWILWVQTSSFVAILAAAGLAIGMALSGTLQNFAGWVMILMFKPYKIWDFIEAGWHSGSVKEIHIFNTILLSGDRKKIIIPNSDISNSSMINYSTEKKRRIDLQVWVSYSDDIDLVKTTLKEIAEADSRIIQKEGLTIAVAELWDNAVIFNYRFFVKSADYWSVRWDILENVKKIFDQKWLNFPFPQRDVHLYKEK